MTEVVVEKETHPKGAQKIHIEQHTFMGLVWFGAWLFTIGFLHLSFWRGFFALVLWPYFLGVHYSVFLR